MTRFHGMRVEDTMGRKFAIRFATVLTAATAERQQEATTQRGEGSEKL